MCTTISTLYGREMPQPAPIRPAGSDARPSLPPDYSGCKEDGNERYGIVSSCSFPCTSCPILGRGKTLPNHGCGSAASETEAAAASAFDQFRICC